MDNDTITDPDEHAIDIAWLTDEDIGALTALAAADDTPEEFAAALNAVLGELFELRPRVLIAFQAFNAMAAVLDAIVYAAQKVGDTKFLVLIEAVMRANGLLDDDEELFERSQLVVPNREQRRAAVKHNGRTTESFRADL
jgi:hypothetical protein